MMEALAGDPSPVRPEIICLDSVSQVPAREWDALTRGHPLASHAYVDALEATRCAAPGTGWTPRHLVLRRNGAIRAAMPLYAKTHSRGEYVFDYAWADAYARYGMPYYPKLVCAIPFTPVPGPRLLAVDYNDRLILLEAAKQLMRDEGYSSLHVLFPHDDDLPALRKAGLGLRENVQFHWQNRGYEKMEDFLRDLAQPKRKKLRQERRRLAEAGIAFKWLAGREINGPTLRYLYLCYVQTYLEHGHRPYLNLDFFERLHDRMGDAMVVVLAERHGTPIAAALNIRGPNRLYGRYWGCTEFVSGLHFETCYMQGIEYSILHGLQAFEGGAQGEHKLARGLLPWRTWSAHWVEDPVFGPAIDDFLERERPFVEEYIRELDLHSPYRSDLAADPLHGPCAGT
jgi:predicted N-acyltransferase